MPEGKKTILVVDDDPAVLRTLVRVINSGNPGVKIIQAETAEAAIAILQTETGVNIVLTDYNMPGGKTGADVVAEARKIGIRAIAVIATMTDQQEATLPKEVRRFEKPFNNDELTEWISKNLAQTS